MEVTGNEYVKLSQLKMLSDGLESDILGQFSDELDLIIGADTTPIPDAMALADKINGEDVSGGSEPAIKYATFLNRADSNSSFTGVRLSPDGTHESDFLCVAGDSVQVQVGTAILYDQYGRQHTFEGSCYDKSSPRVLYIYGDCTGYAYGGGGAG